MENTQELIPFVKEMLRQKPSRNLLKVYLLGSVLAVLGTAVALLETVCHPFSSGEPMDAEMLLILAKQQRDAEAETQFSLGGQVEGEEEEEDKKEEVRIQESQTETQNLKPSKTHGLGQRSTANRLHAS